MGTRHMTLLLEGGCSLGCTESKPGLCVIFVYCLYVYELPIVISSLMKIHLGVGYTATLENNPHAEPKK